MGFFDNPQRQKALSKNKKDSKAAKKRRSL